jgi:hypothetical protein
MVVSEISQLRQLVELFEEASSPQARRRVEV